MRRYASVVRLKPEHREEYLRIHKEVWPSVEDMITRANIRNYSIYLHGDLLFAYLEYVGEDYEADMAAMAADPETQRWWKITDPMQESLTERTEGTWWTPIPEVYHIDGYSAG
jgi:L-rhamnose mutarotase